MGKHRLRSRIKSIVGSLVDPDKDEQLKGSNTETEDNYEKILEILKENDQEDKNKLVELINEFHNRYRSIYERYDLITGKLKEKVQSKKGKQSSSSSSSDSDSEGSSNKPEIKNGKMKDKIRTESEIDELERKLAVETEEKEGLKLQLQETEQMVNQLKLQSDRLLEENRDLSLKLENSKAIETEMYQEIEDLKKEKTGLLLENETSMKTIDELNAIIVQMKGEKQETDNLIDRLREEINFKNGDIERLLEEKEIQVAERNQLQKKIDEMYDEIQNGVRSKEQIVEQQEEAIEDLKTDLEIKGDEVSSLTETVRNLEVKIRLSTQKLHVTEQMLNETEHDHSTKEEKLHQENKSLMERISALSETIVNVKREVQEKVNETLTGVDLLNVKFEEDYGHVTTRVSEITNEIHAAQIHLKQMKDDLNRKVEELITKLKFSEGENARLMKSIQEMKIGSAEKDEKINELENTIHVKDEWISGFCKDKREAIKQLCIWAEYYRDRSDHLQQQLLKMSTGGRRQAVR